MTNKITARYDFICISNKQSLILANNTNTLRKKMKRIGIQIKERRKVLEITQTELADLAGISTNTVVAVERGQGDPKISTYLSICEVLGLEMATKLKG